MAEDANGVTRKRDKPIVMDARQFVNGFKQVDAFEGLADFSWVPRKLAKAPNFKSEKVRYTIWVLGDGHKSAMVMAWDESGGTGTGYDTLYADRNFNGDLTEPDKRLTATDKTNGLPCI